MPKYFFIAADDVILETKDFDGFTKEGYGPGYQSLNYRDETYEKDSQVQVAVRVYEGME